MPKGGRKLGSREPLGPRFWEKVQKTDGCWNWTGCVSGPEGKYGGINILGKKQKAHRVSYELNVGPIPGGLCVLHKCDNPKCVRPDHLFLGTKKDNSQDCIKKGRRNFQTNPNFGDRFRGNNSFVAKLTDARVIELRDRHKRGESYRGLARTEGVHHKTVRMAVTGKTWGHVKSGAFHDYFGRI